MKTNNKIEEIKERWDNIKEIYYMDDMDEVINLAKNDIKFLLEEREVIIRSLKAFGNVEMYLKKENN